MRFENMDADRPLSPDQRPQRVAATDCLGQDLLRSDTLELRWAGRDAALMVIDNRADLGRQASLGTHRRLFTRAFFSALWWARTRIVSVMNQRLCRSSING